MLTYEVSCALVLRNLLLGSVWVSSLYREKKSPGICSTMQIRSSSELLQFFSPTWVPQLPAWACSPSTPQLITLPPLRMCMQVIIDHLPRWERISTKVKVHLCTHTWRSLSAIRSVCRVLVNPDSSSEVEVRGTTWGRGKSLIFNWKFLGFMASEAPTNAYTFWRTKTYNLLLKFKKQ